MTRSLFITALDGVWADLQRDLVEPLEDGHYWIDSVDVLRLDISGYEITADITTIVPGGYYSRERDELESATWEFVSNWARFAWLSFAESAQGETSSNTIYDWSDLTPGLRLVLDGGEHTVTCPGSFVWSVAQRMAGRSDFESTCTIL